MVDANLKVPALEKLIDYAASGIGAVAGPMLAPWKARREAQARLTAAKAEADSLTLITQAQVQARRFIVEPDRTASGMLQIDAGGVTQRIEFQEKKRQANIAATVRDAAEELADTEVTRPRAEPGLDGTVLRLRTGRLFRRYAEALGEVAGGRGSRTGNDFAANARCFEEHVKQGCCHVPGIV